MRLEGSHLSDRLEVPNLRGAKRGIARRHGREGDRQEGERSDRGSRSGKQSRRRREEKQGGMERGRKARERERSGRKRRTEQRESQKKTGIERISADSADRASIREETETLQDPLALALSLSSSQPRQQEWGHKNNKHTSLHVRASAPCHSLSPLRAHQTEGTALPQLASRDTIPPLHASPARAALLSRFQTLINLSFEPEKRKLRQSERARTRLPCALSVWRQRIVFRSQI
eukprot:6185288-Pleurochrysis_carterae.AAC.1